MQTPTLAEIVEGQKKPPTLYALRVHFKDRSPLDLGPAKTFDMAQKSAKEVLENGGVYVAPKTTADKPTVFPIHRVTMLEIVEVRSDRR